ncbi:peptidoglycan-binding protein [Acrocarpospora pleiomorpha]|uniref:peptidoglycan-binding protein n=1 Tax=Acrocarpospora pleiomorpha TaxID=90975 RepID=UPI0012D3118C|nr:peptidoglycan-binding protein [Acrocarpospora pleiomorpha]
MIDQEVAVEAPARHRRRGRTALAVGGATTVLAAAVVAAVGVGGGDEPALTRTPPATARVERTTLKATETVAGSLGYGNPTTVRAAGQGTITWLPAEGKTIKRGGAVYSVDNDKVPLLYGTLPLYRTLSSGVTGRDVEELEQNLKALGYDGFTVDRTFTSATANAVEEWQDNLGVPVTGRVSPGDVVLARAAIRVADVTAAPGSPTGGPVLAYTGTRQQVDVDLDVADAGLVRKGVAATVELPGGATVQGKVTSVGKVATTSTGQNPVTTIRVVVQPAKRLSAYDKAPVDVTIVSRTRADVLAVPVNALVALAEGGYAVQAVDGSYLPVETGLFAGGQVEVTGVAEGAAVVVPR